ncbi:sugar transferase [Rossellomorea marisflavi]|uniref:sugar transferase n=1 Tax=Rossellomorea marisflavi TaxID=189381 RepID=UPI002041AB88|nr:sugar transferase [Rossellomorea marisflavi]MCM2590887.1 sugar transferase [Rossellomorea marisflavi]
MYMKVKRLIDIFLSLIGLLLLAPLFLVIFIAIKVESRGPVFFKQKRIGLNKKSFYILKFRTMKVNAPKDTPTHLLGNPDQYITKVGIILRKTSLDELPQIWNILVGQMSIIGPRPALWNQYDLINERDKYDANTVTPGLTGWAQVNGRDELPIEVKSRYDGEYVDNISFGMDLKCFLRTIISVIKTDGVVEGGTGTTALKEIASSEENFSNEKNINNRKK